MSCTTRSWRAKAQQPLLREMYHTSSTPPSMSVNPPLRTFLVDAATRSLLLQIRHSCRHRSCLGLPRRSATSTMTISSTVLCRPQVPTVKQLLGCIFRPSSSAPFFVTSIPEEASNVDIIANTQALCRNDPCITSDLWHRLIG